MKKYVVMLATTNNCQLSSRPQSENFSLRDYFYVLFIHTKGDTLTEKHLARREPTVHTKLWKFKQQRVSIFFVSIDLMFTLYSLVFRARTKIRTQSCFNSVQLSLEHFRSVLVFLRCLKIVFQFVSSADHFQKIRNSWIWIHNAKLESIMFYLFNLFLNVLFDHGSIKRHQG